MSLRRRFIWGVLLSALVASWAYYAEYLPFTGKWIAAYRLEQYAKEQYPGFRQGKVYFNPCGGPYETTYTGDSGQEVELGCGYDGLESLKGIVKITVIAFISILVIRPYLDKANLMPTMETTAILAFS